MFHTLTPPTWGAILFALLFPGVPRAQDVPVAPPPRPAGGPGTPDALNRLEGEWAARRGAVEVAYRRFRAQEKELNAAHSQLAALQDPEAKSVPPAIDEEGVRRAVAVAERLAEYQSARVRHLEAATGAAARLLKLSSVFDAAAGEAEQTRQKVEEVLRSAEGGPPGKVPQSLSREKLDDTAARLKAITGEVNEAAAKAKADLGGWQTALKDAKAASAAASTNFEKLKSASDELLAALAFQEKLTAMSTAHLAEEFAQLRSRFAETAGAISGNAADYRKAAAAAKVARKELEAVKEPPLPHAAQESPASSQQQYSARLRAIEGRAERANQLVAALDELERTAVAYAAALESARQTAARLSAAVEEVERRVGRGDLDPEKAPAGLTEAAEAARQRDRLGAEANGVRGAIAELRAERESLRRPDSETENIKSLTSTLLAHANRRLDLLADLKRLAAGYATPAKDLPDAEQRRVAQRSADRMARESGRWDWALAFDRSQAASDLWNLLAAYYKELVELDEKQENLDRQKERLRSLVELTRREADDAAKLRAVLAPRAAKSEDEREWDEWLAARLAPSGLKAESIGYLDEVARINTLAGANARRVTSLTGNPPPEPGQPAADQAKQPAAGGEIGQARTELFEARLRGLSGTGIKILIVLVAALLIPPMIMFLLRRRIRGGSDEAGNPSPVLRALRTPIRIAVWVAALALILNVLGFDVTALVIALAIAALVVGLAAQPMIADVLGSVVVFAERRFKVGDVVRIGTGEPARVVAITWRSTALKGPNGLVVSMPNRKVTEPTVENLSRGAETYDAMGVTISTDKDAGKVISVIRGAMAQCKNLTPDQGVTVVSYNQKGPVKVVQYRFWWFLKDYESRNKTRDEVFARIALGLAQENMGGIEVTLG